MRRLTNLCHLLLMGSFYYHSTTATAHSERDCFLHHHLPTLSDARREYFLKDWSCLVTIKW